MRERERERGRRERNESLEWERSSALLSVRPRCTEGNWRWKRLDDSSANGVEYMA